jgi:tetratricopeptide (TPR) repeat protein
MKKIAAMALAFLLASGPARAAFEDQGAGARAPGLGNAFTALADDAYAVYYNPAGLAQMERPQFSTSYSRLLMGLSDGTNLSLMDLAYAHPLRGGRAGTLAVGYQHFAASDLYSEQTVHLSYGRMLLQRDSGSRLLGGLSIKQLKHGFGSPSEAVNACDNGQCNAGIDPVLSGKTSKSAYDADLGFIYRLPRRLQFGLGVMHAMQPDVGFSGSDKVPMSMRFGAAWKSLWMSLMGEVRREQSPTGGTDQDVIFAAERIFPTLTAGQFGLRGSLGFGTREFRQMTVGLGYRINKIELDYAFLMPLGGISGTQGTHRVSFGWHFGAPTPDEEITQELLEQARQLREGRGPNYGYEYAEELRPQSVDDPRFASVREFIERRLYRKAKEAFSALIAGQIPSPALVRMSNRLELVAHYYPDWSVSGSQWEAIAISAVDDFLRGRDRKAMMRASYALSLNRQDAKFDHFVTELESAVGIKAERLPADHPRGFIEEMLARVEAANTRHEQQTVELLLKDILSLDPNNVVAVERVGSMYYILGRYREAIDTWTRALPMETSAESAANLRHYMRLANEKLGGGGKSLPGMPAVAEPAVAEPVLEATPAESPEAALPESEPVEETAPAETSPEAAQPAPQASQPAPVAAPQVRRTAPVRTPVRTKPARPAQAAPKAAAGDTRDVDRLFQKGVEHYARGEYLQATAMFMRILQIDPQNAQARKALERIDRRAPARAQ